MLTDSLVDSFVALAGPDFSWEAARGDHRPPSTWRAELRRDLYSRQSGLCPQCGDALPSPDSDAWESETDTAHVVARGGSGVRRGFLPGNLYAAHRACNGRTAPRWEILGGVRTLVQGKPVLRVSDFARPDLVPTEWTAKPVMVERQKARARG